ncbi:hypothetical protein SeMB42_g05993, partial [Synchytrium endobioticum]
REAFCEHCIIMIPKLIILLLIIASCHQVISAGGFQTACTPSTLGLQRMEYASKEEEASIRQERRLYDIEYVYFISSPQGLVTYMNEYVPAIATSELSKLNPEHVSQYHLTRIHRLNVIIRILINLLKFYDIHFDHALSPFARNQLLQRVQKLKGTVTKHLRGCSIGGVPLSLDQVLISDDGMGYQVNTGSCKRRHDKESYLQRAEAIGKTKHANSREKGALPYVVVSDHEVNNHELRPIPELDPYISVETSVELYPSLMDAPMYNPPAAKHPLLSHSRSMNQPSSSGLGNSGGSGGTYNSRSSIEG